MRADSCNASLSRLAKAVTLVTGCLVVFLATGPACLAAQANTEFTPFVGVYLPTADVFERRDVVAAGDKSVAKHKSTVIFGGRLGGSVSDRVAFEATFGYAPSRVEAAYTDPSNVETRTETSAGVFLASLRVLMGLGPTGGRGSLRFMLGGGAISHGGDAFDGLDVTEGTTDVGAIVGVSARFRVGSAIAIRLDVEDNLYVARYAQSSGDRSDSKFQNDIVISLGLTIPFGNK